MCKGFIFPNNGNGFPFHLSHGIQKKCGENLVITVSSLLPNVDHIGHDVLHANNEFIVDILALDENIPHDVKKQIILLSIKLAQYGDDMGSVILQNYYDFVDKML